MPPPASTVYSKFESVSNLLASDLAEFEYNPGMGAVLHMEKCPDCVQFGLYIFMLGNYAKFLRAMKAHGKASEGPLCAEIERLNKSARIATKNAKELRDALQLQQQLMTTLTEQRDKAQREHKEVLMEHQTMLQWVWDLEQQLATAPRRRPHSPVQLMRHHSPERTNA